MDIEQELYDLLVNNEINQLPGPGPMVTMDLEEDSKQTTFRTASEMKTPRGGYLKAKINLPKTAKFVRIELSLVPSIHSSQVVHPNMLFLTHMVARSVTYKSNLQRSSSWKVILVIKNNDVFYVFTTEDGNENMVKVGVISDLGQLELGPDHIKLNIITPLQGGSKSKSGNLTIQEIIADRLAYERDQYPNLPGYVNPKTITDEYKKNAQTRLELHRCRLRVCLFQDEDGENKIGENYSHDITDNRDPNVGSFEVFSLSDPHSCCDRGGWKSFLVSKHRTGNVSNNEAEDSRAVYPVFVLSNPGNNGIRLVEDFFPNFKQIQLDKDNLTVHNNTFIFNVPAQNPDVIKAILQCKETVHVTLYRCLDNQYANLIKFDYKIHQDYDQDCPYCLISSSRFPITRPKSKSPKRTRYESSTSGVCSPGSSLGGLSPRQQPIYQWVASAELESTSRSSPDQQQAGQVSLGISFEDIITADDIMGNIYPAAQNSQPMTVSWEVNPFDVRRDGCKDNLEDSDEEENTTEDEMENFNVVQKQPQDLRTTKNKKSNSSQMDRIVKDAENMAITK